MTCSFAVPLSDDQLIAALDNDIPPDVAAHLRDCADCRARFEVEQAFEGGLMQDLFRVECPTPDKLRDYVFGILSLDMHDKVEAHLQECKHCHEDIESMTTFSDMVMDDWDLSAPEQPLQLSNWPLVPPSAFFGLSSLVSESGSLRGRGFINGVMLEANGVNIVLQAEQDDEGVVTIIGEFITTELDLWNDALVELWQDGRLKRFSVVDETGVFECNAEYTSNISLVFTNRDEQAIVFNDIDFPKQYISN